LRKIEKILKYVEDQGISLSVFERKAGLSNSYLNNTKKRGEDISAKILDKIKENLKEEYYKIFPEEPKDEVTNTTGEHETEYSQNINYEKLQVEIDLLRERLGDKDATIQAMKGELETLKRLVEMQEKLLNTKESNTTSSEREPYGEGDKKHSQRFPFGQKKEEEKK
jgi:transcriptional regulator with XRE-family HTH domain